MNVKIFVGAAHAYAAIDVPGRSIDVQLMPGRSAHASLRESAAELEAKAARLLRQAETMRQAADKLETGE